MGVVIKAIVIVAVIMLVGLSVTQQAQARRGCCSWHGGVCGCSCCDGSPLSSTCAPYYPGCYQRRNDSYARSGCPANSSYDSLEGGCVCDSGYAPSLNRRYCVKIPANAHEVDSLTDVWLCDYGYEEIGNKCVKKYQKPSPVNDPNLNKTQGVVKDDNISVKSEQENINKSNNGLFSMSIIAIGTGAVWIYKNVRNKSK